jgi:hypothetical protein
METIEIYAGSQLVIRGIKDISRSLPLLPENSALSGLNSPASISPIARYSVG